MITESAWLTTQEDLAKAKHIGASPAGRVISTLKFDDLETMELLNWSANSGQTSRFINLPKHAACNNSGISCKCRYYHLPAIHTHVKINQISEELHHIFEELVIQCQSEKEVFNAKIGFGSNGSIARLYYTSDFTGWLNRSKDLYNEGYQFVAKLDIKNFFPNLTSTFFEGLFSKLPCLIPQSLQLDLVLLLTEIRKGLPISCTGSQFLARLALIPLDLALRAHDVKFVRYQDDLWIHCRSDNDMNTSFALANRVLTSIGLSCTDYKTELLRPERSRFLRHGLMPNHTPLEHFFRFDQDEDKFSQDSPDEGKDNSKDGGYNDNGSSLNRKKLFTIDNPNLYRDYLAPGRTNRSQSIQKFVFANARQFDVPVSNESYDDAGDILRLRPADLNAIVENFPDSQVFSEFNEQIMDLQHPAKEGFILEYVGAMRQGIRQKTWDRLEDQVSKDQSLATLVLFRSQAGVIKINRERFESTRSSSIHHVASDAQYLLRQDDNKDAIALLKDGHAVGGLVVETLESML